MKSVTKVYSLNINKGIVSAQFLGNLVGKNIVQNKIGAKAIRNSDILIRYQITDDFTPDEISFLESQLVEACKLVRDAIKELKESSRKALEAMTDVFLCYDDNARNTILKKYAEIYEVLLGKMVFKRKAIYKEKGKSLDYVYLSTMPIPIQLQFTTNFLSVINTLKEFLLVQVGLFMKLLMSQDFAKKQGARYFLTPKAIENLSAYFSISRLSMNFIQKVILLKRYH